MKNLSDLEAAEVSLVPRGANKRKFLIFKSREGSEMDKETLALIRNADPKALAQVEEVIKAHCEEMQKNEDKKPMMDERAIAALKAAARILTPFKKQLPAELTQKVMEAAGMQMSGEEKNDTTAEERMANSLTKEQATQSPSPIKAEHEAMAMKEGKKAYTAALHKLGYEKYPDGKLQMKSFNGETDEDAETEEEESVTKTAVIKADGSLDLEAVPESVRPVVEMIYKTSQELIKKNAELQSQLDETKTVHREKELVAKAETYTHLALPKESILKQLRAADKAGSEMFEEVTKGFDVLNQQAKSAGLFSEIGSNLPGSGKSTWEAIEKAASGWVQKSGEKMTKEQAVDAFLKTAEGSRMYDEYQAERGA